MFKNKKNWFFNTKIFLVIISFFLYACHGAGDTIDKKPNAEAEAVTTANEVIPKLKDDSTFKSLENYLYEIKGSDTNYNKHRSFFEGFKKIANEESSYNLKDSIFATMNISYSGRLSNDSLIKDQKGKTNLQTGVKDLYIYIKQFRECKPPQMTKSGNSGDTHSNTIKDKSYEGAKQTIDSIGSSFNLLQWLPLLLSLVLLLFYLIDKKKSNTNITMNQIEEKFNALSKENKALIEEQINLKLNQQSNLDSRVQSLEDKVDILDKKISSLLSAKNSSASNIDTPIVAPINKVQLQSERYYYKSANNNGVFEKTVSETECYWIIEAKVNEKTGEFTVTKGNDNEKYLAGTSNGLLGQMVDIENKNAVQNPTVITVTDKGIAEKQANGGWKVTKKPKVKLS